MPIKTNQTTTPASAMPESAEHRTGFLPVQTRGPSTGRGTSARRIPSVARTAAIIMGSAEASARTNVSTRKAPAAIADVAPVLIPIKPQSPETGIPADAYKTAYETAFTSTLAKPSRHVTSWSAMIETLMQGSSLRQHLLRFSTLESSDPGITLLCIRHFLDVQLSLCDLTERPRDEAEVAFMIKAGKELRTLQLALATRETRSVLSSPPSLIHTLTHLCLGAVSINLGKLKKFFPEAESTESDHSDDSSVSLPPDFVNPLYSLKATMVAPPLKATVAATFKSSKTIPSTTSLIDKLTMAGDEYLKRHFPDPYLRVSEYHSAAGWATHALRGMKNEWDPDIDPISMLIRHTEELRSTHQEPIVWNVGKMFSLGAVASAIAVFMTYKLPNPFAPDNAYKAPDNAAGFFTGELPDASASAAPHPAESSSSSATASAIAEAIASAIATATATLSAAATRSASLTASISMHVTVTRSATGSISFSISPSPSPSAFPTPSGSSSGSARHTGTGSGTPPPSLSPSSSSSPSSSYTATISVTRTASGSVSVSLTPSESPSPSLAPTPTASVSSSAVNCHSEIGDFWFESLGFSGASATTSVVVAPDDSLLITGYATYTNMNIFLAKINSRGAVVWAKKFNNKHDEWFHGVTNTHDGGYMLAGLTQNFDLQNMGIILAKVNSNGEFESIQVLSDGGYEYAFNIVTAADGSMFVAAYADSTGGGNGDIVLLKLDSGGNVLWSHISGGPANDIGYNLAIAANGNILVAGYTNGFGAKKNDIFLATFNQDNGDLLSAKVLKGVGDNQVYSIVIVPDGSIFLAGKTNGKVFLAKLNSDATLNWAQYLDGLGTASAYSLALNPNRRELIMSGSMVSLDSESDAFLAIFQTGNGTLTSIKMLKVDGYNTGLAINSNGSLLVTGRSKYLDPGVLDIFLTQLPPEAAFPFSSPLIETTTANQYFFNPEIIDITLNMSSSAWAVTPRNVSVNISDVAPLVQNLKCASTTPSPHPASPVPSSRRLNEIASPSYNPILLPPSRTHKTLRVPTPAQPTPEGYNSIRCDLSYRSSRSIASSLSSSAAVDYSTPTILLWLVGLLLLCAVGRRYSHSTATFGMFSKKPEHPARAAHDMSEDDSVVVDMKGSSII